jgi:hypothetical protein
MQLATDLALALDGVAFARACGLEPDPWQARILRSPSRQFMLNCSRQAGKSTTTALLALHTALYAAPALCLLLSPTLRQSQELFRKVLDGYRALYPGASASGESALRLELANGSRIVALPGTEATIRGYSGVSLLLVDEASRVDDALYRAVRPMLAVSGGRIVALSTPFGRRGWWYDAWTSGGQAWHREEVPATAIPRISAAFLAEERAALGFWFAQEYENKFLDTATQLFSGDDIAAAVRSDIAPLWG